MAELFEVFAAGKAILRGTKTKIMFFQMRTWHSAYYHLLLMIPFHPNQFYLDGTQLVRT